MLSVAVKVFFCKLFLKFFLIHTGKAGGFIDLKVYKNKGCCSPFQVGNSPDVAVSKDYLTVPLSIHFVSKVASRAFLIP